MCPGAAYMTAGSQAGPEDAVTALGTALVLQDRCSSCARPTMKALEKNPSLCHCITEAFLQ